MRQHASTGQAMQWEYFIAHRVSTPILNLDSEGRLLYANPSALRLFGLEQKAVASIFDIDTDMNRQAWKSLWHRLCEFGSVSGTASINHGSADAAPRRITYHYYHHASEQHCFAFILAPTISGYDADLDPASVPPRMATRPAHAMPAGVIDSAIVQADRRLGAALLIFAAIDRFELLRDVAGVDNAEAILNEVSVRLSECFDGACTLAYLDDGEFVAVMNQPNRSPEYLDALRREIRTRFSEPVSLDAYDFFPTVSVGLASYPDDANSREALIGNAGFALQVARTKGRGTFYCYQSDQQRETRELHMREEMALKKALRNDQLILHYQPRVDVESGRVLSVEALLRWNHPKRGLVMPDGFVAMAEETDLIVAIGDWVLRAACEQFCEWGRKGIAPRRIAVNLSPRQFSHDNLVGSVKAVLKEFGMRPGQLELELTESMLMENVELAAETLHQLKALGVHLALDDFGVGHSCLNHIRLFPFDTLKIDKVFIAEMPTDLNSTAIVDVVIALSRRLGMQVVAEGVESLAQYRMLREGGCQEVQGFLLSKPLPAERITEMLEAGAIKLPAIA